MDKADFLFPKFSWLENVLHLSTNHIFLHDLDLESLVVTNLKISAQVEEAGAIASHFVDTLELEVARRARDRPSPE